MSACNRVFAGICVCFLRTTDGTDFHGSSPQRTRKSAKVRAARTEDRGPGPGVEGLGMCSYFKFLFFACFRVYGPVFRVYCVCVCVFMACLSVLKPCWRVGGVTHGLHGLPTMIEPRRNTKERKCARTDAGWGIRDGEMPPQVFPGKQRGSRFARRCLIQSSSFPERSRVLASSKFSLGSNFHFSREGS